MLVEREFIDKAKEKLGEYAMDIIVDCFGLENYDKKNLKASCQYHIDKTPSLIFNKKTNSAHCFSCGRNIDVIDAYMNTGMSYLQAVQKLFEQTDVKYSFGTMGVKTHKQYRYPREEPINNKEKITEYYSARKISKHTLDYCDVREDNKGNIVFNYYDLNDVLCMVKYRPSHKLKEGESKNWVQKDTDHMALLWNMQRVNITEPLLITEGESDTLAAIEAGYQNTVSVPFGASNTQWIEHNFEWLEQFDEIIICADNDKAGEKMKKEVIPRLGSWRCKVVNIPDIVTKDNGVKVAVKDLNEYLFYAGKDKTLDIIIHSQDSPVPSLVDYSDIEERDIDDMEGVYTGFKPMDRELHKLFYGTFNIVSGLPGGGKTSFLYGLVANAVDQNVPCWIFSRELPCWMSKSWFNKIFAGRRNLTKRNGDNDSYYYTVNSDAKREINAYYRDKIKFYRDDYSNDVIDIQNSMEDAARKYACKFFIIDNLMTVNLGGDDNDKYEKQTEFVNWLIHFSVKYQVCTLLVCHPNKTQDTTQNIGMYSIAGSSNIINLGHRAIGLRRISKKEKEGYTDGKKQVPPIPYDVTINVIKDRLTGQAFKEYAFYYDEVSRRFYTDDDEYGKEYSWNNRTYSDVLKSEKIHRSEEVEIYGELS